MKRLVIACVLLAGCGSTAASTHTSPRATASTATCQSGGSSVADAPDATCTPGMVIADPNTTASHVCHSGYNPRPSLSVTSALKRKAMAQYGLASSLAAKYELDHRVPVWAGGATTLANLWPERNYQHPPSAYTHNPKDALEFLIYKRTCQAHTLSVVQARAIFTGDWRMAYATYIGAIKDR